MKRLPSSANLILMLLVLRTSITLCADNEISVTTTSVNHTDQAPSKAKTINTPLVIITAGALLIVFGWLSYKTYINSDTYLDSIPWDLLTPEQRRRRFDRTVLDWNTAINWPRQPVARYL